jgi:cytochrome b pre-mRNA-processing protein 6
VSFQTIMQRRIDKAIDPDSVVATKDSKAAPAPPPKPFNEREQLQQANILNSLLENRYSKAFPMPQSLRYPAGNPTHYDDVVRELDEAPSRSWFDSLSKRIKGSLRFN